ncbi:hypothetical protein FA15DRAFT_588002 [Coprinopsis marcescibilis]|uniref:F-box domain-containing protein n=1 Tax=Coprinopsis marcescibilis TaxID=230819 RepID=A0A5C3L255_COPMA|nr:hypothetical protein FA15DRAFT_588002 [Coprinopsis marcescibilis]
MRRQSGGLGIQCLPLDVFLDGVFTYLYVEDILSLRQVSKPFYLLTHEPIIWRRFLNRMHLPIPPLRPSFRYSMSITDYEIEQLVIQSITVDDNWRRSNPRIMDHWHMRSHFKVRDMFLMPGGKYLITSEQTLDGKSFYLVIYNLDHPFGPRALCRIQTFEVAHGIEAKYMELYSSETGMVIAYKRRRFLYQEPVGSAPSNYSIHDDANIDKAFTYDVVVLYVSMVSLDFLSSPDLPQESEDYLNILEGIPSPFKEVTIISTPMKVGQISMFESTDGVLFIATVIEPGEIHFTNIRNPAQRSTLIFKDHHLHLGMPHKINALRVYPGQDNLIAIRSASSTPGVESYFVEWHDLPKQLGHALSTARSRYTLNNKKVKRFTISDYGLPNRTKYCDRPTFMHEHGPPPPVSIYLETYDPPGIEHHAVYPKQVQVSAETATTPARYTYEYDHDTYQMSTHVCRAGTKATVLPGSQRAMLVLTEPGNVRDSKRVLGLRRYVHPTNTGVKYEEDPPLYAEPVMRRGRFPMPRKGVYSTMDSGDTLDTINELGGASAVCWDESTGRTCIAPEHGQGIFILEGSKIVRPDKRFDEWKKKQEYLFGAPTRTYSMEEDVEMS